MAQQQQDTREAKPVETQDRVSFLNQKNDYSAGHHGHATINGATASATFFKERGSAQIGFSAGAFDFHLHPTAHELRKLASAYAQLANMVEDHQDQQRAAALASQRETDAALMATEGGAA